MDIIAPDLESVYDDCCSRLKSPETTFFTRQMLSIAARFSSVYIMLDAFDECSRATLEDTIDLIHQFKDSRFKIFCTFRPILTDLGERLNISKIQLIRAQDEDVRKYLSTRLDNEWRHDKRFLSQIVDCLAKHAEGKSVQVNEFTDQNIDSCSSNFNWTIFWTRRSHEMQSMRFIPYP